MRSDARLEDRLFNDQNIVMFDGATEEVLRTLPHEVPPKVGKTNQEGLFGVGLER
jgi:hypothetical protein